MKLAVVLGASGEASFNITLIDNPFVHKWTKEFQWCLDNCEFNHQEMFAGLMSLDTASEILTQSCITINRYIKDFIEIRKDLLNQPQDYFNYLHVKFETLSGKFGAPTRLFAGANNELKSAIRNLNFYLHRIEKKLINMNCVYLSFDKDSLRRQPLSEEDYQYFEFKFDPGTLFVHYVELGKDFADLYEDGLSIDYAGYKNLHYYSGEASVMFDAYDCFKQAGFVDWIKSHDFDYLDKRLGHGKIPLGTLDSNAEQLLKQYQYIKEIVVHE